MDIPFIVHIQPKDYNGIVFLFLYQPSGVRYMKNVHMKPSPRDHTATMGPLYLDLKRRTLRFIAVAQLIISLFIVFYSRWAQLAMGAFYAHLSIAAAMLIFFILVHRVAIQPLTIAFIGFHAYIFLGMWHNLPLVHPMLLMMVCYIYVIIVLLLDGRLRLYFLASFFLLFVATFIYSLFITLESGIYMEFLGTALGTFLIALILVYGVWVFKTEYLRMNQQLYDHSLVDPLTQAYNVKKLNEAYHQLAVQYNRTGKNFTIAMFDLDNFKQVNDQLGHDVGDQVLIKFVALIKQYIREQDILVRYGGDEFILLLPACAKHNAQPICQRILDNTDQITQDLQDINISFSAGITDYAETQQAGIDIFKLADRRMYEAKKAGRHTICID